jgi:hypothetical protein
MGTGIRYDKNGNEDVQKKPFRQGQIGNTYIVHRVIVKCVCPEKDKWEAPAEGIEVQFGIIVTITPTGNYNKLDWIKRAETDHVNDFRKWKKTVPKLIDQAFGDEKKFFKHYDSKDDCEKYMRLAITKGYQKSLGDNIEASTKEHDEKGYHTWGGPNARR